MKKPDNVADKPNILPYGSNIGSPAIKLVDIQGWKDSKIQKVNKILENRFLDLQREYEKLIEDFEINKLIYESKFNFEPVIGGIYHLYYSKKGETFLSLIGPNEWKMEFIGSFKYDHDNKWEKI